MVELRKYAKAIQDLVGKEHSPNKNFADYIDEKQWLPTVVKELDKLSLECAKELEKETGTYPKFNSEYPNGQPLEIAPPTRILSLSLILCYWLGWVNNEKNLDAGLPYQPFKAWDRILKAYMAGRELSRRNEQL